MTHEQDNVDPPRIDPSRVDWDDNEAVLSAADWLTTILEPQLAQAIETIATEVLDGTSEARVLAATALTAAINQAWADIIPATLAGLPDNRLDWVAMLNGYDNVTTFLDGNPDIMAVKEAALQCRATGQPVVIRLDDADHDLTVKEQDGRVVFTVDVNS